VLSTLATFAADSPCRAKINNLNGVEPSTLVPLTLVVISLVLPLRAGLRGVLPSFRVITALDARRPRRPAGCLLGPRGCRPQIRDLLADHGD
jgi:hypothetical protein